MKALLSRGINQCFDYSTMSNKKNTGDTVIFTGRFDPRQVRYVSSTGTDADFSYSDGANIEAVKPGKAKQPKIKTVIENTKPQT